MLFSAFDVNYEFMPHPRQIKQFPEIMFLDSGGFETSADPDLNDVEELERSKEKWSVDLLKAVWRDWPRETATVLVSYDSPDERMPFHEQVNHARELFRGQDHHLKAFLLKPVSKDQRTLRDALGQAFASTNELGYFDVIGVTASEVGTSMLERMVNLALLREALDRAGLKTKPIHVFGALDPISSVLFYLAGAEIFDGLTWLRYAYAGGRCVYIRNYGALELELDTRDDSIQVLTQVRNIAYLQKMQSALREFSGTRNFKRLAERLELQKGEMFLRNSVETMDAKLKGRAD